MSDATDNRFYREPAAARPRVVCLCGSMRFEDEIREAAREESVAGHIVVLPLCNMKEPHPLWADEATAEVLKANLDSLHKAKIDLADEIVVVSDASGYIGDSTRSEIVYAEAHGKPVRYWSALAEKPQARPGINREQLIDHLTRLSAIGLKPVDGVVHIDAESMADAIAVFLRDNRIEVK